MSEKVLLWEVKKEVLLRELFIFAPIIIALFLEDK